MLGRLGGEAGWGAVKSRIAFLVPARLSKGRADQGCVIGAAQGSRPEHDSIAVPVLAMEEVQSQGLGSRESGVTHDALCLMTLSTGEDGDVALVGAERSRRAQRRTRNLGLVI